MRLVIEGTNLPGRTFEEHRNVHVALQVRKDPAGPVPGDAASGRWETEIASWTGTSGDPRCRVGAASGSST